MNYQSDNYHSTRYAQYQPKRTPLQDLTNLQYKQQIFVKKIKPESKWEAVNSRDIEQQVHTFASQTAICGQTNLNGKECGKAYEKKY